MKRRTFIKLLPVTTLAANPISLLATPFTTGNQKYPRCSEICEISNVFLQGLAQGVMLYVILTPLTCYDSTGTTKPQTKMCDGFWLHNNKKPELVKEDSLRLSELVRGCGLDNITDSSELLARNLIVSFETRENTSEKPVYKIYNYARYG